MVATNAANGAARQLGPVSLSIYCIVPSPQEYSHLDGDWGASILQLTFPGLGLASDPLLHMESV